MLERAKEIPQEDRDMFPPDFSENLDHYLYSMPKKTEYLDFESEGFTWLIR